MVIVGCVLVVVDCDGDVTEVRIDVVVVDGGDVVVVVLFDLDIQVKVNATSVLSFVAAKESSSLCITYDCKSILSSFDKFKLFKIELISLTLNFPVK